MKHYVVECIWIDNPDEICNYKEALLETLNMKPAQLQRIKTKRIVNQTKRHKYYSQISQLAILFLWADRMKNSTIQATYDLEHAV